MSYTPANEPKDVLKAAAGDAAPLRIVMQDARQAAMDSSLSAYEPERREEGGEEPMTIEQIIEAAGDLAALPHVLLSLMRMTGDPQVAAGDLEKVILTDQAVAARVLALANSAYFGLPRKIFFVREAVVFLGFKTVRNLAMTVNAVNMFFGRSDELSVARAQLWRHSLDVALAAKLVAERLRRTARGPVDAEEAFTAGLLHDVGKMALDIAMPMEYMGAIRVVNQRGLRFKDVEMGQFGHTHAEVGGALAEKWALPSALCEAIMYHHSPKASENHRELVAAVALGNELTDYARRLIDGPEQIAETAPALYSEPCEILRLRPDEMPELIIACERELDKGLALHSLV